MFQSIKNKAMFKSNNSNPWHISSTPSMQQHKERLILLHHARKCPHKENEASPCPVNPQCAEAKRIWRHIAQGCKDNHCSYCYSSRYVLTHYRECKDEMCQVCAPVREEIRLRKQHQQGIYKTETFESQITPSTHPSTIITPQPNPTPANPMPTLTVAICRAPNNVGRLIPVRTRSFSSMSDISHGSSILSSNRSSAPSSRSGAYSTRSSVHRTRSNGAHFSVKCPENLGIAHFCKVIKEVPNVEKSPEEWVWEEG